METRLKLLFLIQMILLLTHVDQAITNSDGARPLGEEKYFPLGLRNMASTSL